MQSGLMKGRHSMSGKDNHCAEQDAAAAGAGPSVRARAEQIFRDKVAHSPVSLDALSPQETQLMLHELRVHQIELELQNEELRRSQLELDAERARYFDLYELAPLGYFTVSEKGMIQQANLAAAALLGAPRGELIGQAISRLIFREDQDVFYLNRKRALESGQAQAFELRMEKHEGTLFWAQLRASLAQGAEGPPKLRIAVHDISASVRAAEDLRRSETKFRALYDFTSDAVMLLDTKGFFDCNQSTLEMFGCATREAFCSWHPADLSPAKQAGGTDSMELANRYIAAAMENGSCRFEWTHQRADSGESFPADVLLSRVELDGKQFLQALVRDISARKRNEAELEQHREHLEELVFSRTAELVKARDAAEAANRAKNAFLSNMSHELRTPMNGIIGMTRLARRLATDPKQIDWIDKCARTAEQLLFMITDVLDIARIEAGELTLEEKDFSVSQVIDEAVGLRNDEALAKGLVLSREIAPELPDWLCGDALRLRQILLNYLSNAIKFSERGQIAVRATAVEQDSHSLLLLIEVADQGIGLTPTEQARLFRNFTQAEDSATRKYGGAGLGLAISKRIAELMGGDAGVVSQEGMGSTFWVVAKLGRAQPVVVAR